MKVPKIRFKEFSEGWKTSRVENYYKLIPTNSFSRNDLNYEFGSVKNIHYGDIHVKFHSHVDSAKVSLPYINDSVNFHRYKQESMCKEGDIILADASEDVKDIGKSIEITSVNNENILAGLHTIHLRPISDSFTIGFSGYLFRTNHLIRQIQKESQGAKVLGISGKKILKLELQFPSKDEQRKIVGILNTVDVRINSLKEKKKLLEKYKKSVVNLIFKQKFRFRNEDGKDYTDWKEIKISKVVRIYDGTHQTPSYVKVGIPFYSVEHVTGNNFSKTKFITEEVFDKENLRVKIEKGDILMTRIGDIGTSKLITWEPKASFYVSLALIKCSEEIDSSYLNQFIKSPYFQKELWKRTIHVAFPKKINLGEIGECKIQLPSLSEQVKISGLLSRIDDKIDIIHNEIYSTELWRKGLMQQIFV